MNNDIDPPHPGAYTVVTRNNELYWSVLNTSGNFCAENSGVGNVSSNRKTCLMDGFVTFAVVYFLREIS